MKYLKSEIYIPLVTIMIPGAIASFPWLYLLHEWSDDVQKFYDSNSELSMWLLLGIVIFVGIIVRDLGLQVESCIIDKILDKKHPGHLENWWDYLKTEKADKTIFDSISSSVLHLTFELGSAISLLIAFIPSILILSHLKVSFWI